MVYPQGRRAGLQTCLQNTSSQPRIALVKVLALGPVCVHACKVLQNITTSVGAFPHVATFETLKIIWRKWNEMMQHATDVKSFRKAWWAARTKETNLEKAY
jgi:hypothetical protein